MIFGLALKSLRAKPLKTFASVAAIAVAVAMLFCTFSFESAVYDYVYEVETADHGESDIIISTKSGGDRLALVQPLKELDGVEEVIPTLSVYALCERPDAPDEYVRLRGFEDGDVGALGGLELVSGSLDSLASHPDDVVISLNAAEHFGLGLGDMFTVSGMTAGGGKANFFVAAIAANTGVFAADSPFTVLGTAGGGIASLISPGGRAVYNEVYVRAEAGTDAAELAERISEMPEYKGLTVSECVDLNYIATRASNLAAPVTIAGVAVALLCFVGLVLVFTSGIADRRSYAARLALVGATKKRIFALFAIESAVMAAGGAVIGSALAVGALALLLHIVLASAASFSVNAALLFAAAAAGAGVAFVASLYPLVKVFSSTARENLTDAAGNGRGGAIAAGVIAAVSVVTLCVENCVAGAKGALSAVDLALVMALAGAAAPLLLRAVAAALSKTSRAPVMVAGFAAAREKRAQRSSRILAVGMTVSMLLFTVWSLTTSVYSGFTAEFEQMILVTNVSSDVDPAEFTAVEGVDGAYRMVWKQADLNCGGVERSVNILGSASALGLADFDYVSGRDETRAALAEGQAVLDFSMHELYGIDVGDPVTLVIDGESTEFEVGALVRHSLFNGAYVILSEDALAERAGLAPDTVVVVADGDVSDTAELVRSKFADRNYYAVPALEAYSWDTRSLENVFDLVAALAFMLTALVFAVALANVAVGRAYSERTRSTLLCAGLSRKGLLASEILEHALSAGSALIFALPASALGALCLINALRMFGLYFGFMYDAAAAVAAGIVLAVVYTLVPVIFGFERRYGIGRT